MGRLVQTGEPAVEPVTLAQMRAALRSETAADDDYLSELIAAARVFVETRLGKFLIARSVEYRTVDRPGAGELILPDLPVLSVDAVAAQDLAGVSAPLAADAYSVSADRRTITFSSGAAPALAEAAEIVVSLQAGFGALQDHVPGPIRQAVRLLVAHWYERREPLDAEGDEAPFGVEPLLAPFAPVRL